MKTLVLMVIVGLVPNGVTLKEVWRIEKQAPLAHCLEMNKMAGQGPYGAVTVRCDPVVP